MALFGLKKDKEKTKKAEKQENVLDMVQEPASAKPAAPVNLKESTGRAHMVLLNHHLTEKTNQFAAAGRYVFKVATSANKIEVKKAVEAVYDVHVVSVNMFRVLGKNRRSGRIVGKTQDWKKAVVTLKQGEKILGLGEGV